MCWRTTSPHGAVNSTLPRTFNDHGTSQSDSFAAAIAARDLRTFWSNVWSSVAVRSLLYPAPSARSSSVDVSVCAIHPGSQAISCARWAMEKDLGCGFQRGCRPARVDEAPGGLHLLIEFLEQFRGVAHVSSSLLSYGHRLQ